MHAYYLSHALAKKGHDITVFCGGVEKSIHETEENGTKVVRLPFRLVDLPPNFLWFQLQNFRRLSRVLGDFDVIHTEQVSGTSIAFLKGILNRPWVVSFHSSWSKTYLSMVSESIRGPNLGDFRTYVLGFPVFHLATSSELRFSDMRVTCSRTLAQEMSSDYSTDIDRFHVISNGVDVESLESIGRESLPKVKKGPTLFFCGRLFAVKGIHFLLQAVSILTRKYPRIKLKIFGRGPLERDIRHYVTRTGLQENVDIRGFVPYETLISELKESDVAVYPSLYEAQSIAMLEAMACSRPVVAFALPFAKEVITDGETGVLARSQDSRDLAVRISYLLDSDHLRREIGRSAKQYVAVHHNWGKIADQYARAYRDAMKNVGQN